MKDPVNGCTYDRVYRHIKKFAKTGDNYCKELISVLQQRVDLEKMYAKGLHRLASKVTKASKDMIKNSIFEGWKCIAQEMTFTADLHTETVLKQAICADQRSSVHELCRKITADAGTNRRALGGAIHQEAVKPICKMLEEHTKRRKSMDSAVEKSSKLVVDNWSQQIRCKKKMLGLTKSHEAMHRAVENNKQIVSEKEKKKLLKKLTKSTETLLKVDQQYYEMNRAGEAVRLKWEAIFEQSYQVIHDLEKDKINLLCNILNKYSQHITYFGRTLIERQMQIHEVVQCFGIDQDIQALLDNTSVLSNENKIGFLLPDYYEEDTRNTMDKERRKTGLELKIQRLQDDISKVKKEKQGLERMSRTSFKSSSFSDLKMEETNATMRDEAALKLTLLEVNFYKLALSMAELEGNPKPSHPLSDCITNWKDKEYYHSLVQISRPVKMRSRHQNSTRSPVFVDSGDAHEPSPVQVEEPIYANHCNHLPTPVHPSEPGPGAADYVNDPILEIGTCKALYDYQATRDDELNLQQGDVLSVYKKDATGWWLGSLRGRKGIFPATYVEELPQVSDTSEA